MGIVDIDDIARKRATRHAERGDNGPARKAQEDLLKQLVGQGGKSIFDFQEINSHDPIQGVWDSFNRVASPIKTFSIIPLVDGKEVVHTEDGGESYTVIARKRVVSVSSDHLSFQDTYVDFIPFQYGGVAYLKVFGGSTLNGEQQFSEFLYQKKNGVWKQKAFVQNNHDISAWLDTTKGRTDFLREIARHNIHRNSMTIDHFVFKPNPIHQHPAAPRPRQRLVA